MKTINRFRGKYRFLSNFFPCEIWYEGRYYPSVEHAYQAAKCVSPEKRRLIAQATSPGKAKRMGQYLELRPHWEEIKTSIMLELVKKKFENKVLKHLLLRTGQAELIEGNTWGDTYWGVYQGAGKNKLGRILMQVRKELHGLA